MPRVVKAPEIEMRLMRTLAALLRLMGEHLSEREISSPEELLRIAEEVISRKGTWWFIKPNKEIDEDLPF